MRVVAENYEQTQTHTHTGTTTVTKQHNPNRFHFKPKKPSMGNKLLVDGVATTDHDTILQCWVDHFKKIMESKARSTPTFRKLLMKWKIC